jgi:hypothetical protein
MCKEIATFVDNNIAILLSGKSIHTHRFFFEAESPLTQKVTDFPDFFMKCSNVLGCRFIYRKANLLKGVCHQIFQVLFWHVWIDLGLYKNL